MDELGLGEGPLTGTERLGGGTQNVLLRFVRSGRSYVLRHPPEHKRANSDETMRREARVLGALAGSDVPHPEVIAACPSVDVLGAAFYLMEPVDGFNPQEGLPEPHASDLKIQRDMSLAMADAIAALGRVDHVAVGLGDFGRPDGWLERQVDRWRSQLDGYGELPGYGAPDLEGVDDVAAWLGSNRPAAWQPGIIHGDFHFGNVLIQPDRPELAAVVDWELATIGDPLLDLGHLLATWPTERGADQITMLDAPGLASADDLIARYEQGSTRDLSELLWYRVLACYRLGILVEGSNARAAAGQAPRDVGDRLHGMARDLFDRALRLIA